MKPVRGRLFLLAMIVFVSLVLFLPSTPLFSKMPAWWKQNLPSKGITLGLDLQGGMHLVLEVEPQRAVEIARHRLVTNPIGRLVAKTIQAESIQRPGA